MQEQEKRHLQREGVCVAEERSYAREGDLRELN